MPRKIVQVNVSQTVAPAPLTLQGTGALISQGGTNTTANTLSLLTQPSDLTPLLAGSKALTSLSWTSNVVTATTTAPHGWTMSDVIPLTIAGATPAGYNGTVQATITGASTFTYPLMVNPGSETVPGTVTDGDVAELLSMVTTFFAQGSSVSVYVLELGESTATEGVAALQAWITANPGTIYSYLVPREWDNNSAFLTFLGLFNSTTAKTYFFITTTSANYTSYTTLMKCAFTMVQAPLAPATEFSCAAPFWDTLSYAPNSNNKVPPLSYTFLFGVTPYPTPSNGTLLNTLNAANVNVVGTGAEGGISDAILFSGHLMDGNPFNYWYSIDWVQLNLDLNIANEVINGSNNKLAPLYYDQPGINRLQRRAAQTMAQAITNGLAVGTVVQVALPAAQFVANFENDLYVGWLVVNAEPFTVYTAENPSDYSIGKYGGMAAVFTPSRGFEQIIFNLNATNFIS